LVCWFVGLLVCWFVGLLVCWFVGLLVCWFVGWIWIVVRTGKNGSKSKGCENEWGEIQPPFTQTRKGCRPHCGPCVPSCLPWIPLPFHRLSVINEWPTSHCVLPTCQANVRGSNRGLALGHGTHRHWRDRPPSDRELWPFETNQNALALLVRTN
jgi:hypothetical protein